jgi:hypothetical protein
MHRLRQFTVGEYVMKNIIITSAAGAATANCSDTTE